ncbi:rad51 [Nannochloropsis gaditana]|uniref:DNA repair protein RAD51 homolog 3 n=1 Tax=Nannochloropsis gaditana TaxID=72520 RepID=W7U6K6_9STRA|nr:rad51 [Nannochloropsis gaditana]
MDRVRDVLNRGCAAGRPSSSSTTTTTTTTTSSPLPLPTSAFALYQSTRAPGMSVGSKIITFCRAIDTVLGGGLARGQLSEVVGVPGAGKTQLAMQVAIDVQIPRSFRGVGGKAVYIGEGGGPGEGGGG